MCVCAHEFIPDGRNSMCEGPGAGDSWTIQGTDGGSGGNRLVLMWGHQEEFTLNKGSMELFAFPECVCLCVYVCVCVCTHASGKAKKEAEAMKRRNWEAPGTQMGTLQVSKAMISWSSWWGPGTPYEWVTPVTGSLGAGVRWGQRVFSPKGGRSHLS